MRLIDTHAHLDFTAFETDRTPMLERTQAEGVVHVVIPGVQADSWPRIQNLVRMHPQQLSFAVGLHPAFLRQHRLPDDIQRLAQWLTHSVPPFPIAVGEIGLDYLLPLDRQQQQALLEQQLLLAVKSNLPVLLHARRAHGDTLKLLRRCHCQRGVVHAFSGSLEEARQYIKQGFLLGFGGAATQPGAHRIHRVLRQLPLASIVLETDAPDMPPAGRRGERNSPEYLAMICQQLATILHIPTEELAHWSYRNSCTLFNWPHASK